MLILNGLFVASLRDLHLPSDVDAQVCRDLIAAEQARVLESSTESRDAPRLWVVTDGIAGRQWSAYLRIMWSGTPLEHLSSFVAEHIGRSRFSPATLQRPIRDTTPCRQQTSNQYSRRLWPESPPLSQSTRSSPSPSSRSASPSSCSNLRRYRSPRQRPVK